MDFIEIIEGIARESLGYGQKNKTTHITLVIGWS